MKKLVVAGSINMDLVCRVVNFPLPGETIQSEALSYHCGGKGANQAVAAARSGATCDMIGAVGDDSFSMPLIENLSSSGVNVSGIQRKSGNSGIAFITVSEKGENSIILSSGSNGKLTGEDVVNSVDWQHTYAILLQNEILLETNRVILQKAKAEQVPIWFNPAPALEIPKEWFSYIHTFIMNEIETMKITGMNVKDRESAKLAAVWLIERGVHQVIITLGEKGCIYVNQEGEQYDISAYAVSAVDTTAAGDTFIGAFAAASMEGLTTKRALQYATAASALTVTKAGAQSSIPTKSDVMHFLSNANTYNI